MARTIKDLGTRKSKVEGEEKKVGVQDFEPVPEEEEEKKKEEKKEEAQNVESVHEEKEESLKN